MKIGILTVPFNNNYGGFLQAYALLSVLKDLGFDVELINRRHNRKSFGWMVRRFAKNVIKKLLGRHPKFILPNPEREICSKGILMNPFVEKYIAPLSEPFFSTKELVRACEKRYDICIAGSDQLWRPAYVPEIENYFFSFINDDNVKRISYAASFGISDPFYSEKQKKKCGTLISKFSAVSVREKSGVDVIKKMGWKTQSSPQLVLDPTMLLDREHYTSLITSVEVNKNRRVFCYLLDGNVDTVGIVDAVCARLGALKDLIIDPLHWQDESYILPPIEQWLAGFRDALFVVTDSFHGTVFSIIFNKPFVVYVNEKRGRDRFLSLLEELELDGRMVSNVEDLYAALESPIDWEKVNELIEEKKQDSINFLKEALGK